MSQVPPLAPPGATQGGGAFPTLPPGGQDGGGGGGDGGNTGPPPPLDIGSIIQAALQQSLLGGQQKAPNPELAAMESVYFQIWGVEPPGWRTKDHGYVGDYLRAGWNLYEFADQEMHKPGFKYTRFYRDKTAGFAEQAAQLMGRR